MNVNIEFLSKDAFNNINANLKYHFDKTIFFGIGKRIEEHEKVLRNFLKYHCFLENVEFYCIEEEVEDFLEKVKKIINKEDVYYVESSEGNVSYFQAFLMLSREYNINLYKKEIEDTNIEKRSIQLTPEAYIELYGGRINHRLQKDTKENIEGKKDTIIKVFDLCSKYRKYWSLYTQILRRFAPDMFLKVNVSEGTLNKILREKNVKENRFLQFIQELYDNGFITQLSKIDALSFAYKNEWIKDLFWDTGSIIEFYTYIKMLEKGYDCRLGVHLDWDGIIHSDTTKDTINEIDVLGIKDMVPVFISCKSGSVEKESLYELDVVASRFGGRQVQKVVVTLSSPNEVTMLRAKEMGIKIFVL